MSALLFILATEIMSMEIKSCRDIVGVKVGHRESTISQYADDTTLTLGNKKSITKALDIIHEFNHYSGLKLNLQKYVGIWLGPYKNTDSEYEGISFSREPVKCLGIYLGTDQNKSISKSWNEQVQKFNAVLLPWRIENLLFLARPQ